MSRWLLLLCECSLFIHCWAQLIAGTALLMPKQGQSVCTECCATLSPTSICKMKPVVLLETHHFTVSCVRLIIVSSSSWAAAMVITEIGSCHNILQVLVKCCVYASGLQVLNAVLGGVVQVGQKRGRAQLEDLDHDQDGTLKKKTRLGWPASQWITVYNKHIPMKQR